MRLISLISTGFLILFSTVNMAWAQALESAKPEKKVLVAYLGSQSEKSFDEKVVPIFKENACKNCEIVNITPYTASGEVDVYRVADRVNQLPEGTQLLYLDFNPKMRAELQPLVDSLAKVSLEKSVMILSSAGFPSKTEVSYPLGKTLAGHLKNNVIIGELTERERLLPNSNYGPEMLTAIRAPKEIDGQGFGPLIFLARWTHQVKSKTSEQWKKYFDDKKQKTKKLWLDIKDFF